MMTNNLRNNFPIFQNHPNLIYLDSAATSQKPTILIESISKYYSTFNSNIGRGLYDLAHISEIKYKESKEIIKKFFKSFNFEVIYTSGSTESINLSAHILSQHIPLNKKYIIIPIWEHHANIMIWQKISKDLNLEIFWLKDIELIQENNIPLEILSNTAIFAASHVSNVTGEIVPLESIIKSCNDLNILTVIDGSQSVTSIKLDIDKLNPDFYCFSAHKLYGPMGLGVLLAKEKFSNSKPLKLGGGIIEDVTTSGYELLSDFMQFEAGTPNIANAYAFSQVLNWLELNNWEEILHETHKLWEYLEVSLKENLISTISLGKNLTKTHISSFIIPNIHSHDVGTFLAKNNICVRVGKHCTHPLHEHLNIPSSIRASIGMYNNQNDVDELIKNISLCKNYFK